MFQSFLVNPARETLRLEVHLPSRLGTSWYHGKEDGISRINGIRTRTLGTTNRALDSSTNAALTYHT